MSSNHDAKRRKTEDGVATDVMGMESKMDRMEENLIHLKARNGQLEASLQRTKTSVSSMQNNISNFRESVENRQKYHEVILRNQKWEYSAPRPSRDYWQSITDDQEEEANAFLDLIEKNTSAMRRGASLTEGMIRVDAELPYHKSLLPHWKEFASAIEQHQHAIKCLPKGEKSRISLVRMDLPDVVTDSLSKALHSTHFHQFFFLRNNLGSSGINFALKYAESNPILEQFFLDFNRIDSKNDFDRLCKIIECHPASVKRLPVSSRSLIFVFLDKALANIIASLSSSLLC